MKTASSLIGGGLFILTTSTTAGAQLGLGFHRLDSGTGDRTDYFGYNLDLWGDTVAVGAMRAHGGDGRVVVFERDDAEWVRTATLLPPSQAVAFFGSDVRVVEDTILVGDFNGLSAPNEFHAYERTAGGWAHAQTLRPTEIADERPELIAMAPDLAIIGAPFADHPRAVNAGCVYVYERVAGQWVQTDRIWSKRPFAGQNFGGGGDLSADVLVIAQETNHQSLGAVEVRRRTPQGWVFEGRLRNSDAADGDHFGYEVDIDRDRIAIAAPDKHGTFAREGAVYVFERVGPQWIEVQKIEPRFLEQSLHGNRFGRDVTLFGDQLLVGAALTNDGGQAHMFTRSGGVWEHAFNLNGALDSVFGAAVAFNERWLLVGAPDLFATAGGPTVYAWSFENGGIGSRYCDGIPNSSGDPVELNVSRTVDASADRLDLVATGLPGPGYGIFLCSRTVGSWPWWGGGDGHLCLGRPVPVQTCSMWEIEGDQLSAQIHLAPQRIVSVGEPGRTLYLQLWYRDRNPQPTTNTSDAVGVRME
ncbi:MAG: hypothetical protein GY711_21790 [bacterium]|nr:hypothetical protein [bacterium]